MWYLWDVMLGDGAIGEELAQLRINRGRSRHEVAERAGLNVRVVERVETGYHANPQWETIKQILRGIGVSLHATYGEDIDESTEALFDVA